jgi:glycosyltransferase involved in cell wall biosynthesis
LSFLTDISSPFFSVITPVYNKGPFLYRSISSVLNQSWSNFELIIVCDPCTDNSLEIIHSFNDSRIKIFHRDQPGPGGYAARNKGIYEAKGKWIALIDADDFWHPDHLTKMYKATLQLPDISILACGWQQNNGSTIIPNRFFQKNYTKGNLVLSLTEYLINCLNNMRPIHTSIACFKANSPINTNLFPANSLAQRGGDLHAWLKLICFHKQIGWSAHIGADYFTNIEGQVVKSAKYTTHLFQDKEILPLFSSLTSLEHNLLIKYLSYRLYSMIIQMKMQNYSFAPFFFSGISFKIYKQFYIKLFLIWLLVPGVALRFFKRFNQ